MSCFLSPKFSLISKYFAMKMATMAGITTKNTAFTTSFHVGSMHCYMNILNGVQLPLRSKVLRFTVPLKYISYPSLALAISPFSTAQWGGANPPWRFQTKRSRA